MGYSFQSSGGGGVQEKDYSEFENDLPRLAESFPYVARLAPFIECSWDSEYMFGLEIIIDGPESRLG